MYCFSAVDIEAVLLFILLACVPGIREALSIAPAALLLARRRQVARRVFFVVWWREIGALSFSSTTSSRSSMHFFIISMRSLKDAMCCQQHLYCSPQYLNFSQLRACRGFHHRQEVAHWRWNNIIESAWRCKEATFTPVWCGSHSYVFLEMKRKSSTVILLCCPTECDVLVICSCHGVLPVSEI